MLDEKAIQRQQIILINSKSSIDGSPRLCRNLKIANVGSRTGALKVQV